MTLASFLSLLIMPLGALVIAVILHFITVRDAAREDSKHPAE